MTLDTRQLAILGSTGSIGTSTLDVVRGSHGTLRPIALSAHSNLEQLRAQAVEFKPRWIVASDEPSGRKFDFGDLPGTEILYGQAGLVEVATHTEIDVVVAAIVGSAGLTSTWSAIEAGKTVALANKETMVIAGPLVGDLAARSGATLLPIDSEHNAVFQAARCGKKSEIRRIVLTASGGPFREFSKEDLANVSIDQALNHPTWDMGPKITIDSATMMNKALEIIEARWLFDIDARMIDVMVHPQSIVHSMVEFIDGSVIAQMSPPDMKLPIQYALTYPERTVGPSARMDWNRTMRLDLSPPDHDRFPALALGQEVAKAGGTAGVVVNAANEAAVEAFLAGNLKFNEIVPGCREILESHDFEPNPSLERLVELDSWARKELDKWILC